VFQKVSKNVFGSTEGNEKWDIRDTTLVVVQKLCQWASAIASFAYTLIQSRIQ